MFYDRYRTITNNGSIKRPVTSKNVAGLFMDNFAHKIHNYEKLSHKFDFYGEKCYILTVSKNKGQKYANSIHS